MHEIKFNRFAGIKIKLKKVKENNNSATKFTKFTRFLSYHLNYNIKLSNFLQYENSKYNNKIYRLKMLPSHAMCMFHEEVCPLREIL